MRSLLSSFLCLWTLVRAQSPKDDPIFNNDLAKVCHPLDRSLDLLFILDGSGSVSGNTFDTQMRMINRIVDMVDIGPEKTKMAIIQYSGYSRMEFDFNENLNKTSMRKALGKIRYISGITRTGRALKKAQTLFTDQYGARKNHPEVAQVVVVVSDGHSHDDPVPPADDLRRNDVTVLTMGIGQYINMEELIQIAGKEDLAYQNESMEQFLTKFRQIAIGELCDYAKKPSGAEILCLNNTVQVNVITKLPFLGHLYVPGYFNDPNCVAVSDPEPDSQSISLTIPLDGCGIQKQFLFSPPGVLFETGVMLKYHPDYNLDIDQVFGIRCFYADMRERLDENGEKKNSEEVNIQFSNDEHPFNENKVKLGDPQLASFPAHEMTMPCAYTVNTHQPKDSCVVENTKVGETLIHQWRCDKQIFGDDYSMLIHSCFVENELGRKQMVIDERGCSTDLHVLETPSYVQDLLAMVPGTAVKFADSNMVKYRCSISLCRKSIGECQGVVPPVCEKEPVRSKRQVQIIRTDHAHMPQHVIDRLFHRRQLMQLTRKANGPTTAAPPVATESNGQPAFITLRPLSSNRNRQPFVPRRRPSIPRREEQPPPLPVPPREPRPIGGGTISVGAPIRPITTTTTQSTTTTTTAQTTTTTTAKPTTTSTKPLLLDSQELDSFEGSGEELEEPTTKTKTSATTAHAETSTISRSATSTIKPTTTTTVLDTGTSEQSITLLNSKSLEDSKEIETGSADDMDLQGLNKDILDTIDIMKVNLESQAINVRDREDVREQGRSPVNWCPRL